MTHDEFGKKLARLLALNAIQIARIKANPLPLIERLAEQNAVLSKAIMEATMHLDGMTAFDLAQEHVPEVPADLVKTATIRNGKARDVLSAALKKVEAMKP